jgi:hypothetical protein
MQEDGRLVHDTLVMPARLQDQVARSNVPSYHLPVGGEDSSTIHETVQLTTPAQRLVAQPSASGYQLPMANEHGVRHSTVSITLTDERLGQHRDSDSKGIAAWITTFHT